MTSGLQSSRGIQNGVPAVLMRGGTSKGVFFHARDLPAPGPDRDELLLRLMGSPDPMQIDGLGGSYSSTSKVVVVERGSDASTVIYWFAQIGIDTAVVDWSGNCGNLTVAVGAFAVDEGLVEVGGTRARIRLMNGNTGVCVESEFPLDHGRALVTGDRTVDGVPGTGAPVVTRYLDPAGAVTGRMLPLGEPTTTMDVDGRRITTSLVDVAHPYLFLSAADLDVNIPTEPAVLNADLALVDRVELIRGHAATLLGTARSASQARLDSPVVPRVILVQRPTASESLEVVAVSLQKFHRALPLTGALCSAAAVSTPGTVPNLASRAPVGGTVRLRHPRGSIEVAVDVSPDAQLGVRIDSVGTVSTARRLFAGTAYDRGPVSSIPTRSLERKDGDL
ncbi:hypothetical protein CH267_13030 [Rhodococcus sp. 06-621-2]|nr:PrpF domain-containing protein [Rhodococcus sp. 06-621-2]OZC55495.1 hypothetical protein CH267_13030 [Rhodococcus sp. 06-621-2]